LIKTLHREPYNLPLAAADALGTMGSMGLPGLLETTTASAPYPRVAAARGLGMIGGSEATAALIRLMDDPEELVVRSASAALKKLKDRSTVPELIQLFDRARPLVRAYIAETLVTIGEPAAVPALKKALSNSDGYLERVLKNAIGQLELGSEP
jgi:HEAT repeat protein